MSKPADKVVTMVWLFEVCSFLMCFPVVCGSFVFGPWFVMLNIMCVFF